MPTAPPAGDLIAALSRGGEVLTWAPAAEALTGYATEEIVGRSLMAIVAAPAAAAARRAIESLRAGGTKFETLLRRKDGAFVEVEIDARADDQAGAAEGAVIRDLTDRRRALRARRQDAERLQLALCAANIGTYEIDLVTERYSLDARAAAIWGRDPSEPICYETLAGQVLEEDRGPAEAALNAALDPGGDGAYAAEFRIRRHDDRALRWVALRGSTFFEYAQPVSRVGIMLDVTERKRAEEANAHFAAIVGASEDAIYSLSLDGIVLSWNPAAERVFGAAAHAMIGRSDAILTPPELALERHALFEAAKRGAAVRAETQRLRGPDDRALIDVVLSIAPVRGPGGEVTAVSVLARDVTEEKRAAAELEAAHAKMAQQRAELDAIFDVLNVPVTVFNRCGDIVRTNAAARAVWGITEDLAEPIDVRSIAANLSVRNSAGEAVDAAMLSALRARRGEVVADENYQIVSPRGLRYDFEATELPLVVTGEITGAVSVWHDVTQHRRKDEQTSLLLRELSHRSKNLLTVIESILRQSAKGVASKEDFVARFSERLRALANSHDLLAKQNSLCVSITDLIFSQVGHHWEPGQGRILMSGLGVRLKPDAAQMIGMALHELSTNAAKYGALSNQTGHVSISWKIDVEDDAFFELKWAESGGPPVYPPDRKGFGTTVIQRVVGQSLNGSAQLDYFPGGVVWVLRAPRAAVADAAYQDAARGERMRSPSLQKLEAAWMELHCGGALPRLADFPLDEPELRDQLIVADVDLATDPPSLRFVHVGKALIARMGPRSGGEAGLSEAEILGAEDGAYRRCTGSRKPAYEYAYFTFGEGSSFFFERLLLPLSDDGETVAHIVGLASFDEAGSAL